MEFVKLLYEIQVVEENFRVFTFSCPVRYVTNFIKKHDGFVLFKIYCLWYLLELD